MLAGTVDPGLVGAGSSKQLLIVGLMALVEDAPAENRQVHAEQKSHRCIVRQVGSVTGSQLQA